MQTESKSVIWWRRLYLKKKFKRTTDSNHRLPVAKNLLAQWFDVNNLKTVFCSDITDIWTDGGWLYLAFVIDRYSRKTAGKAINKRMKVFLMKEAWAIACFRCCLGKGLIPNLDRGSQYAVNNLSFAPRNSRNFLIIRSFWGASAAKS